MPFPDDFTNVGLLTDNSLVDLSAELVAIKALVLTCNAKLDQLLIGEEQEQLEQQVAETGTWKIFI